VTTVCQEEVRQGDQVEGSSRRESKPNHSFTGCSYWEVMGAWGELAGSQASLDRGLAGIMQKFLSLSLLVRSQKFIHLAGP
jgi:hypothetical protein